MLGECDHWDQESENDQDWAFVHCFGDFETASLREPRPLTLRDGKGEYILVRMVASYVSFHRRVSIWPLPSERRSFLKMSNFPLKFHNSHDMSQKQGSYYFSLSILLYAMISGVLIFSVVAAGLQANGSFSPDEDLGTTLMPLCLGLGIINIFMSDFLFKQQVKQISAEQPLYTRQSKFRSAFILRLALLEGAALFCIVVYLLSGHWLTLLGGLLLIGWMAFNRPTMAALKKYLFLTKAEETEMFG